MKLEDKLIKYGNEDYYGFHMPGHKRQNTKTSNPFLQDHFSLSSIDITEIDGFDDLHDPHGILMREMKSAAAFYGTRDTIFSVNGSTASNLAAVSAAVPRGGKILIESICHRSVFHAAALRELAVTLLPVSNLWPEVPGPVDVSSVKDLMESERFDAVVVTSPTYEGIVSDIREISEIVHAHGAVLIVDEAHGAHFSMHPYFPVSAIRLGADLVIQSLHKTLPSLTQTSLLHNVTGRVSTDKLMEFMDIYESSSPSYILMASITSCIHLLEEKSPALFEDYVVRLSGLRASLAGLRHLKLLNAPSTEPSKLVISTDGTGIDGPTLYEILLQKYHLQMEMKTSHHILAMTSVCDTQEGFTRFADALSEIDSRLLKPRLAI